MKVKLKIGDLVTFNDSGNIYKVKESGSIYVTYIAEDVAGFPKGFVFSRSPVPTEDQVTIRTSLSKSNKPVWF